MEEKKESYKLKIDDVYQKLEINLVANFEDKQKKEKEDGKKSA